jgi:hypothetical protein
MARTPEAGPPALASYPHQSSCASWGEAVSTPHDPLWDEFCARAKPEHALSVAQELSTGDLILSGCSEPEEWNTGASFIYTDAAGSQFLIQVFPHLPGVTCRGCGDYVHLASDGRVFDTSGDDHCYPAGNGPHVPRWPGKEAHGSDG